MLPVMWRTKQIKRGFTLIEIVAVLALIGLTAASLAPMILTYLEDAKRSRAEGEARQIAAALGRLAKDVAHFPASTNGKQTGGPANIKLLCGRGDLPRLATGVTGWAGLSHTTSTPCNTGSDVDKIENHLVKNLPGGGGTGTTPYPTGPRGRVWRGSYLQKITEDPYGRSYVVNIMNAPADSSGYDRVVWVCSAGPDGKIDTPGDTLASSGPDVQGDDVCSRLK